MTWENDTRTVQIVPPKVYNNCELFIDFFSGLIYLYLDSNKLIMKTKETLLSLVMMFTILSFTACEKTINGCTDAAAKNYNPNATENDGSCVYTRPCEVNVTGEVYFKNLSVSNRTYDIIWDGSKLTTVPPNQQSAVYTFSANVKHSLIFRYTNTSDNACTPSEPILSQCMKTWYSCSY